jgi:hypothetical protein
MPWSSSSATRAGCQECGRGVAVAVAPGAPLPAALVTPGADQPFDVALHQQLQHRLGHGSHKISLAAFSNSSASTNLSSVILAFRDSEHVGTRDKSCIRGSLAGLCAPLPSLRRHPHGCPRTAWGRCGTLLLHRSGLAPPTLCRFRPAHQKSRLMLQTVLSRLHAWA